MYPQFHASARTTISSPRTETMATYSPAAPSQKNFSPRSSAASTVSIKEKAVRSIRLRRRWVSSIARAWSPGSFLCRPARPTQRKRRKTAESRFACSGTVRLEEGAAPEAFNLASLYKLPVLFLCENNGKYGAGQAIAAAQSSSMAAYPLTDLPKAYKVPAQQIDGMDAGLVHATVSEAVKKIRGGEGPQFIEAQTVRYPGSETNWPTVPQPTDTSLAWDVSSVPEKAREWYRSCDPLLIFIRELFDAKQASREEITNIERKVKAEITAAVEFAMSSPYPKPEEAERDFFA